MKNNGWVRWTQRMEGVETGCGQMPIKDLYQFLRQSAIEAKTLLKKTGADHVLYGVEEFDRDGDIALVTFYMKPMTDQDFVERVRVLSDCHIYAVHKNAPAGGAISVEDQMPEPEVLLHIEALDDRDGSACGGAAILGNDGRWYWAYNGKKDAEILCRVTTWSYLNVF